MNYPSVRFLKDRGILLGSVFTCAKRAHAVIVQRQHPGFVAVHVAAAGQQGHIWLMSPEDADRMGIDGYPKIDWATWNEADQELYPFGI
jgi:hypothetical protein